MAKSVKRLIVSFIGKTDVNHFPPSADGKECSPILRLLLDLNQFEPRIPPSQTQLLLFNDDRDGKTEREEFCEKLRNALPSFGLGDLILVPEPIKLPEGATDLNALYECVRHSLSSRDVRSFDEVFIHLSSGTPAMQFTLLLVANILPLENTRMFETSREKDVQEVRLPYVLAAREIRGRERVPKPSLNKKARGRLLPDTVIDDPLVEAGYAALFKSAETSKIPPRLLLKGPVGSGKWHACQQFARWRDQETVYWLEPDQTPALPEKATVMIRHLDAWPEPALGRLTTLAAERPDLAIAATFRTDLPPTASLESLSRDGLRGAATIELPALGARSDVVALAEALARQLGQPDGKLKQRFQYELLTDVYPRNLHDLKSLLATTAASSPGLHPDQDAYLKAKELSNIQALLNEAWQILAGMDFSEKRHKLKNVLDVIEAAIVRRAVTEGRSQEEAGKLLGIKQTTVSNILKSELDLSRWRNGPQYENNQL